MLNSKKSTKAGGSCPLHSNGERGKHWKLPYCLITTVIGLSIYRTMKASSLLATGWPVAYFRVGGHRLGKFPQEVTRKQRSNEWPCVCVHTCELDLSQLSYEIAIYIHSGKTLRFSAPEHRHLLIPQLLGVLMPRDFSWVPLGDQPSAGESSLTRGHPGFPNAAISTAWSMRSIKA